MSIPAYDPPANRLFAKLPSEDTVRLLPHIMPATWALGNVIYDPGQTLTHLYFPTTAVVSLVYGLTSGVLIEIGVVGNEGVVGLPLVLGGISSLSQAIVQSAGSGFLMPAAVVHVEFQRGGAFQRLLLLYTQALMTQIAQTAVCNRVHSIAPRLCRWLLSIHERMNTNEVYITHAFMAQMLGVRRESITVAAQHLRAAGVIRYGQGHITVVDRTGLEGRACECYGVVKNEFTRLLGWPQ